MKNRDYYWLLINKEPIELKANSKWERDLQIDQTSLKTFFTRVKSVCKDNKLREFYFKLLHRIVVTKKDLFLFGKAEETKCPYCGINYSIIHTFHSCNWSQSFFLEVITWFNKENVTSFSLSPTELLFGMRVDASMPRNRRQSAVVVAGDYFSQLGLQSLRSSVIFHLSRMMAKVFFYREMNNLSTADFYTTRNKRKRQATGELYEIERVVSKRVRNGEVSDRCWLPEINFISMFVIVSLNDKLFCSWLFLRINILLNGKTTPAWRILWSPRKI